MIKVHRFYKQLCLGALLLGAVLRLIPLVHQGIWNDELYSLKIATFNFQEIAHQVQFDPHPALFYGLVRLQMKLAENLGNFFVSTSWVRLLPAIPSFLTCLILWRWATEVRGRMAGWLALTLGAISPCLCFFAQEIRSYSLLLMFITLAGWGVMRLQQRANAFNALLFAAASLGHLYLHNLSIFILAGNVIYLWGSPLFTRQSPSPRRRFWIYAAFLVIAILYFPQLQMARVQFSQTYDPEKNFRPDLFWIEIFTVPFNELLTGPIPSAGWSTPFGMFMIYGCILLVLALVREEHRSRPSVAPDHDASTPLGYVLFLMLFYLWTSGALTLLNVGRFFTSERLIYLAYPFWLMTAVLTIESVARARSRRVASFILIAIELPCALIVLDGRVEGRSDFLFLQNYVRGLDSHFQIKPRLFNVNDSELAPWISKPNRGIRIESIEQLVAQNNPPQNPIRIIALEVTNHLLALDEDIIDIMFTDYWCACHGFAMNPLWLMRLYEFPNTRFPEFRSGLLDARARLKTQLVHGPDHLVLPGWCHEFESAYGLAFPEYDGQTGIRWTVGPEIKIYWRAPMQTGRYQVKVNFWRPYAYPSQEITVDYRFAAKGPWKTVRAGKGGFTIQTELTTIRPRQDVKLEMMTDFFIPKFWIKDNSDMRKLGLMFTGVDMTSLQTY